MGAEAAPQDAHDLRSSSTARMVTPWLFLDPPLLFRSSANRVSNLLLRHEPWWSYLLCRLKEIRYHSRPAGLMAGADTSSAITVEVFMERDVVAPLRIVLKERVGPKDRPAALLVTQKDVREPPRELLRHLPYRQFRAGAGWVFYQQIIAIELMVFLERFDQQEIDGEPDRPAPVRIPPEGPGG
jgi:hypothetical protein